MGCHGASMTLDPAKAPSGGKPIVRAPQRASECHQSLELRRSSLSPQWRALVGWHRVCDLHQLDTSCSEGDVGRCTSGTNRPPIHQLHGAEPRLPDLWGSTNLPVPSTDPQEYVPMHCSPTATVRHQTPASTAPPWSLEGDSSRSDQEFSSLLRQ